MEITGPTKTCRRGHVYPTRDECLECKKIWRAENRDKIKEGSRAYYIANRERILAQRRIHNTTNKNARLAYGREWGAANKPKQFEYDMRRRFGMEPEDYARILHSQDRKCAACNSELDMGKKTHVDHCHATGKVRGILCHHCNLALGYTRDSENRLRALVVYLEKNDSRQFTWAATDEGRARQFLGRRGSKQHLQPRWPPQEE